MKKSVIKEAPAVLTVQLPAELSNEVDRLARLFRSNKSAILRMALDALAAAHPAQAKPATR